MISVNSHISIAYILVLVSNSWLISQIYIVLLFAFLYLSYTSWFRWIKIFLQPLTQHWSQIHNWPLKIHIAYLWLSFHIYIILLPTSSYFNYTLWFRCIKMSLQLISQHWSLIHNWFLRYIFQFYLHLYTLAAFYDIGRYTLVYTWVLISNLQLTS